MAESRKAGRPIVPDHLRRRHRVDIMINADEREVIDGAGDGRPRATLMREWSLAVASGDVVPLPPALRPQIEAHAQSSGISVAEWLALACLQRLAG